MDGAQVNGVLARTHAQSLATSRGNRVGTGGVMPVYSSSREVDVRCSGRGQADVDVKGPLLDVCSKHFVSGAPPMVMGRMQPGSVTCGAWTLAGR